MNYKKLLTQAIDLHVHVGPEVIPRKYTVKTLIAEEAGSLATVGIKNHFFPTIFQKPKSSGGLKIIYSIALNDYVGGLNAKAIIATAQLSKDPIIVWFPTISARNIRRQQKTEIPTEWLPTGATITTTESSSGIGILDKDDAVSVAAKKVLKAIQQTDAILATGHLSWQESRLLVKKAADMGITRMIITHPIYTKINMPIAVQREVASLGAFIEHSYSMYAIDKIPIARIARQIAAVGAERCILTSDVGQVFSLSPSRALKRFAQLLIKAGVSEIDIKTMLIINPSTLISRKTL